MLVWSENFDSGDSEELTFGAWTLVSDKFETNNGAAPTVTNNALQMPNTRSWGTWSDARRNTTVAYGTWSFDYNVKEGSDHSSCDTIFLVINDIPWDMDGVSVNPGFEGYILTIKSGSPAGIWTHIDDRSINLAEFEPITHLEKQLATHQFPSNIVGSHNIGVTRDLQGEFKVYFDSTLIITHTDNSTTTSEMCVFGSWIGDSTFDNIAVCDSVGIPCLTTTTTTTTTPSENNTTTTPSVVPTPILELTFVIPSAVLILVLSRLSEKRKKN